MGHPVKIGTLLFLSFATTPPDQDLSLLELRKACHPQATLLALGKHFPLPLGSQFVPRVRCGSLLTMTLCPTGPRRCPGVEPAHRLFASAIGRPHRTSFGPEAALLPPSKPPTACSVCPCHPADDVSDRSATLPTTSSLISASRRCPLVLQKSVCLLVDTVPFQYIPG